MLRILSLTGSQSLRPLPAILFRHLFEGAPQRVTVTVVDFDNSSDISLPWGRLKHFFDGPRSLLRGPSGRHDNYNILAKMQHVIEYSQLFRLIGPQTPEVYVRPVCLSRLRIFHWGISDTPLPEWLVAPSLDVLILTEPENLQQVISLIRRSACSLTTLHLGCSEVGEIPELLELFEILPNLIVSLSMGTCAPIVFLRLCLNHDSDPSSVLLPKLRTMIIMVDNEARVEALDAMLRSRSKTPPAAVAAAAVPRAAKCLRNYSKRDSVSSDSPSFLRFRTR